MRIDLNADVGEGLDNDIDLLGAVTSVNIACGYHAGDHAIMAAMCLAAAQRGVAIGAHPGLPDRQGFGRRAMALAPKQIYNLTVAQTGALWAFARTSGAPLRHVKPHGALYWMAEDDEGTSHALVDAVRAIDPSLAIVGLSGGRLVKVAAACGLRSVGEIFADRAYRSDGSLVPRSELGATIEEPGEAADRMVAWARSGSVPTVGGGAVKLTAGTICIHGDGQGALTIARRVRYDLERAGVRVAPVNEP